MKIAVNDKWAAMIQDDTLIQNSPKVYVAEFVFDDTWEGFSKTVIFEAGPASVIVTLTEDRCTIPAECLKRGSVKLKIGVYGVKGDERKATVWCPTSLVIPNGSMSMGTSSTSPSVPGDMYDEIMAAIGDLSAAGFEGKTLAEVFREIRDHVCETATDEEVDAMLTGTFGQKSELPENPDNEEKPDNTATDKEVEDILNDVFGKLP